MRVRYSTKHIISLALLSLLLLCSLPLRNVWASPDSQTLRPNAAGDLTQLLPKTAPNHGEVDEAVADGDTSYVEHDEGGTSGNYEADLYNLPDSGIPAGSTINNVTFYYTAKKIQVGTAIVTNARATFKTHGTTYVATAYGLTTSYAEKSSIYTTNPNSTLAWTIAEIDALQAGPSLQFQYVGDTRYSYARCTQFYVVIDYTIAGKAWHNVSTWTASLGTRTWSSGTSWEANLIGRTWSSGTSWSLTLLTSIWKDVATWETNLSTMMWRDISWLFSLTPPQWANVAVWTFSLLGDIDLISIALCFLALAFAVYPLVTGEEKALPALALVMAIVGCALSVLGLWYSLAVAALSFILSIAALATRKD